MNKSVTLAHKIEDYKRIGITKEPAVWEDGMRTDGQAGSYEWWYFDAEYTDGTKIVVVFYTKNEFDVKGDACPTIRFDLTLPDGRHISKKISEEKGSAIRASKQKCDVKIDRSSVISCDIISDKKYKYTRQPIIMIAKNGVILEDREEFMMIERQETINHPFTKKFMDNKLKFNQTSGKNKTYQIEYHRKGDIVADSLLSGMKLSFPQRIAVKLLRMNPTYVRCIGTVTLTVRENGKQEVYEQEGLWEQMFFAKNKEAIIKG
ncbi:hypothetical protein AB4Z17_29230 [Paenibacillus sp. TAF43_2]|uniref:hypothetical protein n=1 Tax=Paenibacillus sp. TAF43_2 TaxID=3233069 RepID=UPI003F9C74E5